MSQVATPASGTAYLTGTPDGSVLSERLSSGTYDYLHDGLGSVVGVTNSSGCLVNQYSYDPYGNTTSATEGISNPFRFIRAIWESSTGLYKMGERYYDPSIGRFTQLDPLGGGYVYAGDDPANLTDPLGLRPTRPTPMQPYPGETGRHTVMRRDAGGAIRRTETYERNPYTGKMQRIRHFDGNPDATSHRGVKPPHVVSRPRGSRKADETARTSSQAEEQAYLDSSDSGTVYYEGSGGGCGAHISGCNT